MNAAVWAGVVVIGGLALLGASTLAFQAGWIGPMAFMVLTGAGIYVAYTPFNAMLFDRMIAFSGRVGTAEDIARLSAKREEIIMVLRLWHGYGRIAADRAFSSWLYHNSQPRAYREEDSIQA